MKKRISALSLLSALTVIFACCTLLFSCQDDVPEDHGLIYESNSEGCTVVGIKDTSVTELKIPSTYGTYNVTAVADGAFRGLDKLQKLEIPDTVTKIGVDAFSGCESLTSVKMGKGVVSIGARAFFDCKKISEVHISDVGAWCGINFADYDANPLSYYGKTLYLNGEKITELVIPEGVTKIPAFAFYNQISIVKVTLPTSLNMIGNFAFSGCEKLVEACNGSSLNIVKGSEDNGFVGAGLLNLYTPESANSKIAFSDGFIFFEDGDRALLLGHREFRSLYILPSEYNGGGYYVYDCAFKDTGLIRSITVGKGVLGISDSAFEGCNALEAISVEEGNNAYSSYRNCLIEKASNTLILGCKNSVIPSDGSVERIGDGAFYENAGLSSIVIPDSVKKIEDYAFFSCSSLTSVTLGEGVEEIEENAFVNCFKLARIYNNSSLDIKKDESFGYIGYYATDIRVPE